MKGIFQTSYGCLSALVALSTVGMSSVEATQYIIKYKDPSQFEEKAVQVFQHKQALRTFGFGPLSDGVKVEAVDAVATDALEQLEMLILDGELSEAELATLANDPRVEFIEKEYFFPAPTPVSFAAFDDYILPVQETPWGIDAVRAPAAWGIGGQGDGIRVMVLDTGVDRNHPALMNNLEAAQDFTNDRNSEYPYYDLIGHGTHVAGTVLADGSTGLPGVAPRARLLVGKVCAMSCSSAAIMAGVNWAIREGVDVVNMSLGGPFPSPGGEQAYRRADEAGVMIVAASGNDGRGRVSFPAAYPTVFSVGAVDESLAKAPFSNWGRELDIMAPGVDVISAVPRGTGRTSELIVDINGEKNRIASNAMDGSAVVPESLVGELVFAGLGRPQDIGQVNLRGKVALIARGEISFGDKARNAIRAGAIAVVMYNNEAGPLMGTLGGEVQVPVVAIDQVTGEELRTVEAIAKVGTLPSDYMALAGTSMASPHVAGVAALVKGANPSLSPAQIRDVMRSTTAALEGDNSQNQLGRGLVNAEAAVRRAVALGAAHRLASLE